jgi:hypothetical protein
VSGGRNPDEPALHEDEVRQFVADFYPQMLRDDV